MTDETCYAVDAAISVVIPAYNEANRIGEALAACRAYFAAAGRTAEVIVVDDGSRDGTADIANAAGAPEIELRVMTLPENRGKGAAVRAGVLAARHDVVLMMDADLSAPGRGTRQAAHLARRRLRHRDRLARPAGVRARPAAADLAALAGVGVSSVTATDHAARDSRYAMRVQGVQVGSGAGDFPERAGTGWLFDCEVLGLASQLGYKVKEVGIVWGHHDGSRVHTLRMAATAIPILRRIRRRIGQMRAERSEVPG